MRLAGRKKDSAWQRTMKKMLNPNILSAPQRTNLEGQLEGDNDVVAMAQAYIDILAYLGVDTQLDAHTLVVGWLDKGIPREVWFGYSRFDSFSPRTSASGKTYLVGDHAQILRTGAHRLREILTQTFVGIQLAKDLVNTEGADHGNPGGVADANKTT